MVIIIDLQSQMGHYIINKQQKFYSLPQRYKQIQRFKKRPFVGNALTIPVPNKGPFLKMLIPHTYTGHIMKFVIKWI
jgi:regulator of RNase E activity RraA